MALAWSMTTGLSLRILNEIRCVKISRNESSYGLCLPLISIIKKKGAEYCKLYQVLLEIFLLFNNCS